MPDPDAFKSGGPMNLSWPLRPWLSLGLLLAVLASGLSLVVLHRGESTVGTAIAGLFSLGPQSPSAPPPLKLLVWKQNGDWDARDLAAPAEVIDAVRKDIGEQGLLSAEYSVVASPFKRSGFWAPTTIELDFTVRREMPPGKPDLEPADANAALDIVADQLRSRRLWAPAADPVRDFDGSKPTFSGAATRTLRRGWIQNALTALLGLGFLASLTRRPNTTHDLYDAVSAFLSKFGAAAVLGVLWTASPAVLGLALLYFLGDVAKFLRTDPTLGWFGYVAVFIVSAGIGFLPTYGQSFLGGWVFGFARGFPGAMLGFVGGSVIGYFIAQRVGKDRVQAALEANPKARKVRNALIGQGFWKTFGIVTLIRVPPNSPFALTNLALASSGVGLLPYVLGTAVGMAPRTAVAVWLAAKGASTGARDIQDFVESQPWWSVPAGFGILFVVLAILGWIGNRALHEVTKGQDINVDVDAAAD